MRATPLRSHAQTYALDSTWRPLLSDLGVSAAEVLRRARLPADLLHQAGVRLDAASFHRFWEGLGEALGDPLWPLRVCQAVRTETFSPSLFAALCSPNFAVAVQRIARYKALVAPMQLVIGEQADGMTLELRWADLRHPPPASLVATELLFFVALARLGTREPVRPLWVTTPDPPAPAAPYSAFLGVEIRPGPCHQIAFALADAQRPFLTRNEGLWSAFEPELRTRLAELDAAVSVGQRVRASLLEALPSGQTTVDAVASQLAMSPRTLQRQLALEGLSFSRVLKEARLALARHYLSQTALPMNEVAFLLGFEEPNSFFRAFRAWTGGTPDACRKAPMDQP